MAGMRPIPWIFDLAQHSALLPGLWMPQVLEADMSTTNITRTDEAIADRVMVSLWEDPFLDPTGMRVSVADGVVTLTGNNLDPDQVLRATSLLADLICVRDVVDGTIVRFSQAA
jgi:osmotically-inducible protein OsmY